MEPVAHATSWTNFPTSVSSPSRLLVSVLLGKSSRITELRTSRPFEELVPRLDIESCRDTWFLEKTIKLSEDRFENFKEYSLNETISKILLLNVPVTKETVSHRSQS
jgi:hypothetical protein